MLSNFAETIEDGKSRALILEFEELFSYYQSLERELPRIKQEVQIFWEKNKSFLSDDIKHELAREMYWNNEEISTTIPASLLETNTSSIRLKVGPEEYSFNCVLCSQKIFFEVHSRARLSELKWAIRTQRLPPWPHYKELLCERCQGSYQQAQARRDAEREYALKEKELDIQRAIDELKTMPYSQYLKTNHWQELRKKALRKADCACQVCNATNRSLHVHHRTYERRGEELLSDLTVLCNRCHEMYHKEE